MDIISRKVGDFLKLIEKNGKLDVFGNKIFPRIITFGALIQST
jgi:hypothetical protein